MTNDNENPRGLPVALTLLAEVLPPKPLGDVSGYSFAMSATNSAELHNRFARVATDYAALQAEAEALRADAARLDALEALVGSCDDRALLLHHGRLPNDRFLYCGLGLGNTGRTLRQAIDQARGEGVADEA